MNILFVSIDNLRYDCVAYQQDKSGLLEQDSLKLLDTPTLDRFSESSLCFSQCVSTNTYTTASHASILTGLYPPHHGVRAYYKTKLSREATSLAEILKGKGYQTVLYTDYPQLFGPNELDRGFELLPSRTEKWLYRLLRNNEDKDVFLFAHFFDVHEPFLHNTNEYAEGVNEDYLDEIELLYDRFDEAGSFERNGNKMKMWSDLTRGPLKNRPIELLMPLFVKGITKFDRGRFRNFMGTLEETGFLDDALVVLFSDHGEGRIHPPNVLFAHCGDVYDNVLRVPLSISHPDLPAGVNDELVSTVDIAPTVLSLLEVDPGVSMDGIDILSANREAAYAETWTHGKEPVLVQTAVRTESEKFIVRNHKGNMGGFEDGSAFDLDDEGFVKKAYQDILGREAEPAGLEYHVDALKGKSMTREELLQHFLSVEEYLVSPRYAYFDLAKDPAEDSPMDPTGHRDWKHRLEQIESVSSGAVAAENVFAS